MPYEVQPHAPEPIRGTGWSGERRDAIWAECQHILSHQSFSKSKRCLALFRHLVEVSLTGYPEELKERVLGIEVFGRKPDYDTNSDPVVRMTANEIRKRLAQYYQEIGTASSVRVQLAPGSYSLDFVFKGEPKLPAEIGSTRDKDGEKNRSPQAKEKLSPDVPLVITTRRWRLIAVASTAILLAMTVVSVWIMLRPSSTQALIWSPLIRDHGTILVCLNDNFIPDPTWASSDAKIIRTHQVPPRATPRSSPPASPFIDALTAARVMASLGEHHQTATMMGTSEVTLQDLRRGPAVLIGAFDNPWALALVSGLRFRVMVDPVTDAEWIEDSRSPNNRIWIQDGSNMTFLNSTSDYALVTRFRSQDTGTWIVAIEGLGMQGTEAAGELLTNPNLSSVLPTSLRNSDRNFQIVLKTTVINGQTSLPQILATSVW
jgi:hypothetical protein